jgi:aspartate kinase
MNLIVQKFGGSSLADSGKIKNVSSRIVRTRNEGYDLVVVVSALGDTTDKLLELAYQITDKPEERELDMLISTGEQVSGALLAMAIHSLGQKAVSLTGSQIGLITDTSHTRAKILDINGKRIAQELKEGKIVIVTGFQGVSPEEDITTLGRGGSDLTAVAIAGKLKAEICEIYTDVGGVYTADPKVVPEAKKLEEISYDEMLEMAQAGAKVMQARSIEFAKKYNVPIRVKSSFTEGGGTLIMEEVKGMEKVMIRGVAANTEEAKIAILGVPDQPGVAAKIFEELAKENVNVDMIIQSTAREGANDISFTAPKIDLEKSLVVMKKVLQELKARDVIYDEKIAKVSVVGVGMRSHPGVAAKMFKTLAEEGINIEMISTSEIKISCVIAEDKAESAVKVLHKAFELEK